MNHKEKNNARIEKLRENFLDLEESILNANNSGNKKLKYALQRELARQFKDFIKYKIANPQKIFSLMSRSNRLKYYEYFKQLFHPNLARIISEMNMEEIKENWEIITKKVDLEEAKLISILAEKSKDDSTSNITTFLKEKGYEGKLIS